MKTAAKVLAVVVFFACLGWVGLSLYWHFKILGAIRTMQSEAGPAKPGSALGYSVPEEPMKEIEAAGCRALSYLVDSLIETTLEPSKNPAYLVAACVLISKATVPDPSKPPARPGLSTESMISAEDSPPDRAKKCNEIREWWRLYGNEFHQGWRIWTDRCAKD